MIKVLQTALLILLGWYSAYSQQWFFSPSLHGRDINDMKIFSPDTILVVGGWQIADTTGSIIDSTRSIFKSFNSTLLWNVYADTNAHWLKSTEFTDEQNGIAVGAGSTVLKTNNRGETWSQASVPVLRDFNKIFLIDSLNFVIAGGKPSDAFQSGIQTILKSTDAGQTWNIMLDQNGPWLKSLYFLDSQVGFAVGDSGTILKTINGGNDWTSISAPVQRDFNSIWFTDMNNGIIAGGNFSNDSIQTILRTTNGGDTWAIFRDALGGWLTDVYFLDKDTGYIAGDRATLLKTINGGQTWTPQIVTGAAGDVHFNTVRFITWDFGIVAGKQGELYVYTRSRLPEVYALSADLVDSTHAVLNGTVNTFGQAGRFTVTYSTEKTFQTVYFLENLQDIKFNGLGPVHYPIADLIPDTTYYFLFQALSLSGSVYSDTLTFFTGISESEIKTLEAANITGTSAQLNGTIKGFTGTVNLFFQYGTTPSFGNQIMATPPSVNDTSQQAVSSSIGSLLPNSLYFFRLKGVSGSDTYYGDTYNFFTGNFYNTFQAAPATNVTDTSAVFNGIASGFKIPALVTFEQRARNSNFNSGTFYNTTLIGDSLSHFISEPDLSLHPGRIYYYWLKATTILGVHYSDTLSVSIGGTDFRAQTLDATSVTESSAILNGKVQQLPEPADLSFQYGLTSSFGSEITATPAIVSDTLTHNISAVLNGLQDNTLYFFRLKAETSNGAKYFGETKQIFTGASYIPNWDFQEWDNSSIDLLYNWFLATDRFEKVPGHSGNSAIKIFQQNLVTLASLKNELHLGTPFNSRPDSIAGWFKYDFPDNDSLAGLIVTFLHQGNVVADQFCYVTGNSAGVFNRLAFKIDYQSLLVPDTIVIKIFLNRPTGSLVVDDIHFSPSAPAISNGDFENWFPYAQQSLQSWNYPKFLVYDSIPNVDMKMVTQATFNHPLDYAAEIHNVELFGSGGYMPGSIGTGLGVLGSPLPSFPVFARHLSLNGYFKYFPINGDTMMVQVDLSKNGQHVGEGKFIYGDSVTQYMPFSVPIVYGDSSVVPDSAIITIFCSKDGMAHGPSHLIIDKLSFDGLRYSDTLANVVPDFQDELSWKIYPNPANNLISIQLASVEPLTADVVIFDLTGKTIYNTTSFMPGGNAPVTVQVSLKNFSNGFYLLGVQYAGKFELQKLVVVK